MVVSLSMSLISQELIIVIINRKSRAVNIAFCFMVIVHPSEKSHGTMRVMAPWRTYYLCRTIMADIYRMRYARIFCIHTSHDVYHQSSFLQREELDQYGFRSSLPSIDLKVHRSWCISTLPKECSYAWTVPLRYSILGRYYLFFAIRDYGRQLRSAYRRRERERVRDRGLRVFLFS